MKKIIIDTNCLISFVSDRNGDQQEKIAALFNKSKQLKCGVICHHHVISEFVYVLTNVYSLNADKVQQMVADLKESTSDRLKSARNDLDTIDAILDMYTTAYQVALPINLR